ncbi:MAG TPA: DNA polymerase III subunit alpha [Coriobacteriia bacterium]|nr:DNA polymerase III subunit alpha [Coriobacteriia bacterium]
MSFVHLHTHTEYSTLDGAARVKKLVERARDFEMESLAITDHGYMYGAVDFYKSALKVGIKPIIGCECYFTPDERGRREGKPNLYHLLLLAKNNEGYRNLMAMVSDAAVKGFYYKPQIDLELLKRYSEGVVATSACMSGILSKSIERGEPEEARRWAEEYARIFAPGDFYVEIQEQGIVADNGVSQTQLNRALADLAGDLGLPLVATNDIHYLTREDAKTQDLLLCIGTGSTIDQPGRMKFSCDEFYMKSAEEMAAMLPEYPEALANTLEIAEKCNVSMEFGKIILPKFEVPEDTTEEGYLRSQCMEGLKVRYGDPIPEEVLHRLDTELEVVVPKGIAAYFLIVQDFTTWAKANGIGVGPGRGSAAGSIIAYALGITDLDPIENGLLFERFLNPERTEMPDIDMDFDDERRGDVIDYVREKYGNDKVAQIITFSTMKARAAVRDAGRVLGYPYGVPDKISKMILDDLGATIDSSLAASTEFKADYDGNPDTKRIVDAARSLEGIVRGEGVHAAGVVICRDPLHYYVPVKYDTKGGAVITQYDGPTVADLGLLKMDFLGLRTLTVIAKAIDNIETNHGIRIDPADIPLDDPKVFELFQRADTVGVFQVESPGMRQLLKDLVPTTFADIVAVLALYRPGPLGSGMVKDFVERKHGRRKITYYDDRLEDILRETYGAIVYQEQVMRISMAMSGFSAAKADKLRKAMGKKQVDVLTPMREAWVEGARENDFDAKMASDMWEDILKFAEYAFNKSHSAAYGLLTMQTAYLKAHYPLEFMAAVLTSWTGKTDKIVHYVAECNRAGKTVLPPDVNSSGRDFTAVQGEGIRFGLAGIRGVGEGVVDGIAATRAEGGHFTSLQDFCDRVDLRQTNKKTIESLIKAGAFDSTGYTRKHLMSMMDAAVDAASKRQKDRDSGQVSMFDMFAAEDHGFSEEIPAPNGDEWDKKMKLAFEKEMLGIYVSDHPLRDIEDVVRAHSDGSLGEELAAGTTCWFAGMLSSVALKPTKKGPMMAIATLEDLDGSIEAVLFPAMLEKYRELIVEDAVLRLKGKIEEDDRGRKLIVLDIEPFDGAEFAAPPKRVVIRADGNALVNGRAAALKKTLTHFPGRDIVELHVWDAAQERTIVATMPERVNAEANGLYAELMEMFGAEAVEA